MTLPPGRISPGRDPSAKNLAPCAPATGCARASSMMGEVA